MYSPEMQLGVGSRGYLERSDEVQKWRRRLGSLAHAVLPRPVPERIADAVREQQERLWILSDSELKHAAIAASVGWQRAMNRDSMLTVFACVREAARRSLGVEHYATQLDTGAALLHGRIVEMETGEGKTLAATLPASVMALAGVPVQIITVNDYLAERDAAWMEPIYQALGIEVGVVTGGMSNDARRKAYRSDVTYCSNKELVFDFLRDRLVLGDRRSELHLQFEKLYGRRSRIDRLLLPGLCFAIVDEADSVLIDETRTPLVLSQPGRDDERAAMVHQALAFEQELQEDCDYRLDRIARSVELEDAGRQKLEALAQGPGGLWLRGRLREELAAQAIAAQQLYRRDEDYIVRDQQVLIVDPHTGRALPGRSWSQGLHAFIEAKEGCPVTPEPETLARLSYQRFFRRYLHLAGMTGTQGKSPGNYGRFMVRVSCPWRRANRADDND